MALLAGALGGGAIVSIAVFSHSGGSDTELHVAGLGELDRHVQALTEELQALRMAPMSRGSPAEPATTSAVEPLNTSTDADLKALIARLDALLGQQDLAHTLGAVGGAAPLEIPDPAATEPARQALLDTDRMAISSDHILMTYQQIAERYGRPTTISVDAAGSILWRYESGDASNRVLTFIFLDGLVSSWR